MSELLRIHSDLEDELTEAFGVALDKFIDDANGMFGYVMGDTSRLEKHTEALVRDYLVLGRLVAEITNRSRQFYDPSPEDSAEIDAYRYVKQKPPVI